MDTCLVDVTVEFLAVAFHNILYYTNIYHKSIFEMRKKYSAVVYQSLHPEVNEYIDRCLKSIAEALKTDELYRVEFVVTDKNSTPEMKFVFDFDRLAVYDETADAYLVRCEQNLRSFCLLLANVSHKFMGFSKDCNFTIYLYTNESFDVALANMPHLEDFPLVEVEERLEEMDNIMPLRRFAIRNYSIDAYIELPKPWTFCS